MNEKLLFPIGFDLDQAVIDAQGEWPRIQKKMETMINSKPLTIPISIKQSDAILDAEGNIKAATGSIKAMRAEMQSLIQEWNKMSESERLTTDEQGRFIGRAGEIVQRFAELTTASRTYARTLQELQSAADKAVSAQEKSLAKQQADEDKHYQAWLAQKEKEVQAAEKAEQRKENARRAVIAKQNQSMSTSENTRYNAYWAEIEKQAQAAEKAEARKRTAANATASAMRQAAHEQAQAAFKVTQTLKAQETSINAINAKLQIYQNTIKGQEIGSEQWNKSALEIRRLSEELSKATQRLSDFQQKSFQGLSDSLTKGKVQALTQYREQLQQIEAKFNALNQTGGAYQSNGMLSQSANAILKQRQAVLQEINKMLTTAADAQIQREKEINKIIEQRKAKAAAVAAKHKEQQAAIRANIERLKEERRILNQQESSIANISAKLGIMNTRLQNQKIGSKEFEKTAKEVERLTKKLEEAKTKVDTLTNRTSTGSTKQAADHRRVAREIHSQNLYLQRLAQRLVALYSIRQVSTFLTKVREVTAEFELQRTSLAAILQDQGKATQIFSQIKTFALKSPVSIFDLTKYTKQLAAYKIGYDELFDTTKRLADVSVGLGVSMDRIILLYGQIRATGYLRASEVRQATEAGIPIVESLASKLSQVNGELVTAKDVMEMISKRAITFDMVKDVFQDMTSAGGLFFNMQEKQGNTLYGLWAKLGDAASIMYDSIGRTESVNKGMKELIYTLTNLMRNWQDTARQVMGFSAIMAVLILRHKMLNIEYGKKIVALRAYAASMAKANALQASNARLSTVQAFAMRQYTRAMYTARTAASAFGISLAGLRSLIVTTGWGALLVALGYLVDKLWLTKTTAEKASEAIAGIVSETSQRQRESVRNFETLAKKATEATEGSLEQREALEELQRTYKDLFPQELLELKYLQMLDGQYGSLTNRIKEYIAEQQKRRALDEISSTFGAERMEYEKRATDIFRQQGWSEDEIAKFWVVFRREAAKQSNTLSEVVSKAMEGASRELIGSDEDFISKFKYRIDMITNYGQHKLDRVVSDARVYDPFSPEYLNTADYLENVRKAIVEENKAIAQYEKQQKAATYAANEFAGVQNIITQKLKKLIVFYKEKPIERDSYIGSQIMKNFEIQEMTNSIKKGFAKAGITWQEEFGNFVKNISDSNAELISTLDFKSISIAIIESLKDPSLTDEERKYSEDLLSFVNSLQKRYNELVPSDEVVRVAQVKFRSIAEEFGGFKNKYNQFLMTSGEKMEEYGKRLKESITEQDNQVQALKKTQKEVAKAGFMAALLHGTTAEGIQKRVDEATNVLNMLQKFYDLYFPSTDNGNNPNKEADPRLQILQEMVTTLKQINSEYTDLAKKEGDASALKDTKRIYEDTFKNIQSLARKYNFSLPNFGVPTDTKALTAYLEKIRNVMRSMPKSEKAVLALQLEIDKMSIDEQQKVIQEQLDELSDRIKRTKTAQDFYKRILDLTGDMELSMNISMNIYGDDGGNAQSQMAEYIRTLFDRYDVEVPVSIISKTGNVDYKALEDYVRENKKILGDGYKELISIAQEGQSNIAKSYEGYLKDLEVAKTYADKRIELARYTSEKIKKIEESNLPEGTKKDFISRYNQREQKLASGMQYEAFKNTTLYVQMFQDLGNTSSSALKRMRDRLKELQDEWSNLDPVQLKEIQSRIKEIDTQISRRNPIKELADAYKKIHELRKAGRSRKTDEQKAFDAEKNRALKEKEMLAAEEIYEVALKNFGIESEQTKQAKERVDLSKAEYEAAEQTADDTAENAKEWDKVTASISRAVSNLGVYKQAVSDAFSGVRDMMEAFGADSLDLQFLDDIASGFDKVFSGGMLAGEAFLNISSGNPLMIAQGIGQGIKSLGSIASGFSSIFHAGKVRKANQEIKKQEDLLDRLQQSYSKLEEKIDSTFGTDFLTTYNNQISNLQAQQTAYLKQAEAERSKGKKQDKEKVKEYERQAEETAEKIKKLQDDLVSKILETDVSSAAKDFAKSWLEAKLSFSNTTDVIKQKFNDMMKNLIVNQALGQIVKNILQPFYDEIDSLAKDKELTSRDIYTIVSKLPEYISKTDNALNVGLQALESAGLSLESLRDNTESFSGISRNVASATSEEINENTTALNTQNFYISQIHANVAAIAQSMLSKNNDEEKQTSMTMQDLVAIQNGFLSNLPAIEANTARTAERCERAASACESIASQLSKVIKPVGIKASHSVSTTLNS